MANKGITREMSIYYLIFFGTSLLLTVLYIRYRRSIESFSESISESFSISNLFRKKAVGVTTKGKNKKLSEETTKFLDDKKKPETDDIEKSINYLRSVITPTDDNLARQELIEKKQALKKPLPVLPTSKLGGQGTCRFLSSSACSEEYPVYMGASLGIPDDSGFSLSCNSDLTKPAKGIAIMDKGKLEAVVLLDKGEGYKAPPKITIKGKEGQGAYCRAMLDDEGAISKIVIENPGTDYTGTPKVDIELPNVSSSCHLCCKKIY